MPNSLTEETLFDIAAESSAQLIDWAFPIEGDMLDFRRVDEYFNYFAPAGYFSSQSIFFDLDDDDLLAFFLTIAFHLSGVLVADKKAQWIFEPDDSLIDVRIAIDHPSFDPQPFSLYRLVAERFVKGASSDNLDNLESLISIFSEYEILSVKYVTPIDVHYATDDDIKLYSDCAEYSRSILKELGFNLNSSVEDLYILDFAINLIFEPGGMVRESGRAPEVIGGNVNSFIIGMGFHLGRIFIKHTEGKWISHPDYEGVCVSNNLLRNLYPIRQIFLRTQYGSDCDPERALSIMDTPLVCASLARKVQRHEFDTREELTRLLKESLPAASEEESSEATLEEMIDLIYHQAGV